MAVEDHPKYPDWRRALDALIEANDRYQQEKTTEAWVALQKATINLARVAEQIDA